MSNKPLDQEVARVLSNPEGNIIMSKSLEKRFGENLIPQEFPMVEILNSAKSLHLKGKFVKLERFCKTQTAIVARLNSNKLISFLPHIILGDNLRVLIEEQEFFGELLEFSIHTLEDDNSLVDFCFSIK